MKTKVNWRRTAVVFNRRAVQVGLWAVVVLAGAVTLSISEGISFHEAIIEAVTVIAAVLLAGDYLHSKWESIIQTPADSEPHIPAASDERKTEATARNADARRSVRTRSRKTKMLDQSPSLTTGREEKAVVTTDLL